MTKIEALISLISDNGGSADWDTIYDKIKSYYPNAQKSQTWKAGLRGVLYRGVNEGLLQKLEKGIFAVPFYTKPAILDTIFPDSAGTEACVEGAKITVAVNKYERSSTARQKCIAANGCYCHICGMVFQELYGEIGHDFIHVHHKIPLNKINEEYIVDPINDLIPVCPNCHAMLHRKINGKYLSIAELRAILKK